MSEVDQAPVPKTIHSQPAHLLWALATVSGCLNGAAFIFYGPLTFIANLPLLFALGWAHSWRQAIALGGWVGFLGGVHIFGVLGYGWWIFWAFSLYTASQMVIFGAVVYLFRVFLSPRMSQSVGLFYELWIPCIIWTLTEWIRTVGPVALPASYVGCIADIPWLTPLLSWASIWGGLGVSAMIALVPSTLYLCLSAFQKRKGDQSKPNTQEEDTQRSSRRDQDQEEIALLQEAKARIDRNRRLLTGLSGLLLLAALYLWGMLQPLDIDGEKIKVAGLQGGFSNALYEASLADPALSIDIIETYEDLLRQAREAEVDLMVWAESAIRVPVIATPDLRRRLIPQSDDEPWLIAGLAHTDPDGKQYNLAISAHDQRVVGRYEKVKTVPGVEARFTPGDAWRPLPTRWGPIGVLICFESIYPHAGRAMTQRGARLLIVLSNDAGFGETPISHHMTNRAIVRAVENGRWLLRVGQAGVTTLIDPQGRQHGELALFEAGILKGEARLRGGTTHYVRTGIQWLWIFFLLLVLPPLWVIGGVLIRERTEWTGWQIDWGGALSSGTALNMKTKATHIGLTVVTWLRRLFDRKPPPPSQPPDDPFA